MRQDLLGSWSTESGIQLPKLPFLKRRHNLHNETLRATILAGPGVSIKRGCMPNGTCTGGVDTMARHISDIFPFDLRISPARMNVMDYTMPLYTTDQRMYIQKPAPKLVWNRYLKPFDSRVWSLIVCLFLIHIIIIISIRILHKRRVVRDLTLDESYKTLSDIFFLSFAAMCNESIPEMSLLSLRITQFTIYTTLTILYAAYSAILITSLAFQTFEPPFTTMEGLMEDGSYDLGILKDSADYDFFQNTSIKILSDLFEKMMSYEASLPTSRIEGLRRICSNNKYAYLAPDISTQYFPAKNCTLIPLNVISRNAPFSMALQYKSPFKDIINYRINVLRESGILNKIFKDAEVSDNEIDNSWVTVELPDVFPLIVILLVSYVISLVILIWESIYAKQEKGHHVGDITRVIVQSRDYLPYRN
ncbi:glutamate receptor ionotropic, kainate 2-like [Chelonus insularis]|uniref:glutamate receptor ionotropic, kainate 2-like n=1 Tax=Chelonus insularis TaxID=460826 RepID=UPI00158AE1BF|nr:glutamate receptor ionotropic, kainate 2-like [Chelonus insularis]